MSTKLPLSKKELVGWSVNHRDFNIGLGTLRALHYQALFAHDLAEWRDRVIDGLVVCEAYRREHEDDPKQALADLIEWHVQVALDPAVSEEARRWERERDELRAENERLKIELEDLRYQEQRADRERARAERLREAKKELNAQLSEEETAHWREKDRAETAERHAERLRKAVLSAIQRTSTWQGASEMIYKALAADDAEREGAGAEPDDELKLSVETDVMEEDDSAIIIIDADKVGRRVVFEFVGNRPARIKCVDDERVFYGYGAAEALIWLKTKTSEDRIEDEHAAMTGIPAHSCAVRGCYQDDPPADTVAVPRETLERWSKMLYHWGHYNAVRTIAAEIDALLGREEKK